MLKRVLSGRTSNLEDIEAFVLAHPVPLRAPLVLISQAHRSGGTLLSQLFDGHPSLAAHPNEITIGYPTREAWPPIDPALGADRNFYMMFDDKVVRQMQGGYFKGDRQPAGEHHPFFLVPRLHYRLFRQLFVNMPPKNQRDILNHYFTAYFNAWLNYKGHLAQKRWITGFAPRLASFPESTAGFFEAYPDGRLIQIIREPTTWYASAKHHGGPESARKGPEKILEPWCASAESTLRNVAAYGDKTIVVRFEDLVGRTEQTMRMLAQALDIVYAPTLAQPTFNGEPMWANSSFAVQKSGVIDAPLQRAKTLDVEERELIERRCRALYEKVLASCCSTATR